MRKPKENKNCPYCMSPVKPDEDRVRCPRCGVIHHTECWKANGQCSVYGCDGWVVWSSEITDKLKPAPEGTVDVSQTEAHAPAGKAQLCIKCGALVGPKELVCWKCRHNKGETHYFENCFGPAAIFVIAAVSSIVWLVRVVT